MASLDGVPKKLDLAPVIKRFSERNTDYYVTQFFRIQKASERAWSFNWAAALLGPLWAAARGMWSYFWVFAVLELVAFVQFGRGLWGDLGAAKVAEATQLQEKSAAFLAKAESARSKGESTAGQFQNSADNLARAAEGVLLEAEQAVGGGTALLMLGAVLIIMIRVVMGLLANSTYEKQFTRWQTDKAIPFGCKLGNALFGVFLAVVLYPLTLYRFTASKPDERITSFPIGSEYYTASANTLEDWFDRSAMAGKGVFDGITATVQSFLELLELIMIGTPWPVIVIFLFIVAWRAASVRVAIFCTAGFAYLGFLGFWETAMITFALIGAASSICILIGIPLGIWFSKSAPVYAVARPVLDLMQTVPPFVYLIPIIAFFGTGRVPGVLATIIVGMPPVIRLTALGLMQVDKHVKEAARAFGASNRQVLTGIELPLAIPSIMTGVNQTILLCLAMVVIASLIGAKGLGQNVLMALQWVAKGQGILAGLAILVCAMVLDRIVQGRFQREDGGK